MKLRKLASTNSTHHHSRISLSHGPVHVWVCCDPKFLLQDRTSHNKLSCPNHIKQGCTDMASWWLNCKPSRHRTKSRTPKASLLRIASFRQLTPTLHVLSCKVLISFTSTHHYVTQATCLTEPVILAIMWTLHLFRGCSPPTTGHVKFPNSHQEFTNRQTW